ncbi:fatty acid hydroxylase family protein [Leptospira ognonensis]|uniref:Fatty acid hydroxylase family protein n=1 Tax=Leptospira ognonensis TaxID=2484945 RepID=A0A4R9JX29_9LEPT|nr:sterol desaturase family protein [Leptospira ognonensis]TGL56570.1 fatty acid hydroxylase family protein [Leptospira ognonensis]
MNFEQIRPYLIVFIITTFVVTLRYLLFAGSAYIVFWKKWRDKFSHRIIQGKLADIAKIKTEIFYSLTTMIIFGMVGTGIFAAKKAGWTQIYDKLSDYSIAYFLFSIVAMILIHDAYFYVTHRLMHHKKIFKHVHLVHHLSTNPSPWAAFSFHPFEAVIEAGIVPLIISFMPVHGIAIFIFLLYMTFLNVLGHLAFETFPKGFVRNGLTNWHNTTTHHNMHHKFFNCNYGLYFNWWDKLFKTNHKDYGIQFELITSQPLFLNKNNLVP